MGADFANPEMLARLVAKFQAVRAEMLKGIADCMAAEADQLAAYTAFMAVSQQTADDAVAEEDLATEIARWDAVQATFDTLFAELANEQDAINEVIDVVSSITISE